MIFTTRQILDFVEDLVARKHRSYLILVPPGCDARPDIATQIERILTANASLRCRTVAVSGDTTNSEADFVQLIIQRWCDNDRDAASQWERIQEDVSAFPE